MVDQVPSILRNVMTPDEIEQMVALAAERGITINQLIAEAWREAAKQRREARFSLDVTDVIK